MKQTINGITYDTARSKHLADLGGMGWDLALYQSSASRFFCYERRFYVDGKLVPKHKATSDLLPPILSSDPAQKLAGFLRTTSRERLFPVSRRKALALCIRSNIPRTFHKDLARFLK